MHVLMVQFMGVCAGVCHGWCALVSHRRCVGVSHWGCVAVPHGWILPWRRWLPGLGRVVRPLIQATSASVNEPV